MDGTDEWDEAAYKPQAHVPRDVLARNAEAAVQTYNRFLPRIVRWPAFIAMLCSVAILIIACTFRQHLYQDFYLFGIASIFAMIAHLFVFVALTALDGAEAKPGLIITGVAISIPSSSVLLAAAIGQLLSWPGTSEAVKSLIAVEVFSVLVFVLSMWVVAVGSYLGHVVRLGYRKDVPQAAEYVAGVTPPMYENKRSSVNSLGIVTTTDLPYTRRPSAPFTNHNETHCQRSPSRNARPPSPVKTMRSPSRQSSPQQSEPTRARGLSLSASPSPPKSVSRGHSPVRPLSRSNSPQKPRLSTDQSHFSDFSDFV